MAEKLVHYYRVVVNNRVRCNRVSLCLIKLSITNSQNLLRSTKSLCSKRKGQNYVRLWFQPQKLAKKSPWLVLCTFLHSTQNADPILFFTKPPNNSGFCWEENAMHRHKSGVNFTNILRAAFMYVSFASSFFCDYILGLYFTGARLLAQKLRVERWWNWPQMETCWLSILPNGFFRSTLIKRWRVSFTSWRLIFASNKSSAPHLYIIEIRLTNNQGWYFQNFQTQIYWIS